LGLRGDRLIFSVPIEYFRPMKRRYFLLTGLAGGFTVCISSCAQQSSKQASQAAQIFEITKTEAEWRKILTPEQFVVLRQHGTEPAGSSPLDQEHRKGTFVCAGCALPLFASTTKFDSGTGWPSFYAPLKDAIGTKVDRSYLMERTEVHCRRCGGHLGHVFNDGPKPTGKRYCMNGIALKFIPNA
jgi:peptide-methionine (R)-S-oxide reductase